MTERLTVRFSFFQGWLLLILGLEEELQGSLSVLRRVPAQLRKCPGPGPSNDYLLLSSWGLRPESQRVVLTAHVSRSLHQLYSKQW